MINRNNCSCIVQLLFGRFGTCVGVPNDALYADEIEIITYTSLLNSTAVKRKNGCRIVCLIDCEAGRTTYLSEALLSVDGVSK